MQKIIYIGDVHMTDKELHHGKDPYARLQLLVEHINTYHKDTKAIIFLGDLSQEGSIFQYVRIQEILKISYIPIYFVAGNHDNILNITTVFGQGYFVDNLLLKDRQIIFINSSEPGTSKGCISKEELIKISKVMNNDSKKIIILHHPPLILGFPRLDTTRLNSKEFQSILCEHKASVELIVFGHTHRCSSGTIDGTAFLGVPSIVSKHRNQIKFENINNDLIYDSPEFVLSELYQNSIVNHFRNVALDILLQEDLINWKGVSTT